MRSLHGTAARFFGLALFAPLPLWIASIALAGCTFDTPGAGSPSISDEAGLLDTGVIGEVDAKADARDAAISVQDASISDADAGSDTSAPDASETSARDTGAPDTSAVDSAASDAPHDAADAG